MQSFAAVNFVFACAALSPFHITPGHREWVSHPLLNGRKRTRDMAVRWSVQPEQRNLLLRKLVDAVEIDMGIVDVLNAVVNFLRVCKCGYGGIRQF